MPLGQSGDPNYPLSPSWLSPRTLLSGLALATALLFGIWGLARRRHVGAALAIVWFYLYATASSIFPLAEIVNEHRPYLAAASLCGLAAWALIEQLPRLLGGSRQAQRVAVAVLLATLGVTTFRRNAVWRSEESLWRDVVAKSPESARGQMNYGLSLMSSGRLAEAEPHLREAVRLAPAYPYAHINFGNLLLAKGETREGLSPRPGSRARPGPVLVALYRGLAAEHSRRAGRHQRVEYFAAATSLSPNFADGWYRLALARDAAGDAPGALAAIRHAAALRGSWDDRFVLSYLLLKFGDVTPARALLVRLNAERPGDVRVKHNLQYAAQRCRTVTGGRSDSALLGDQQAAVVGAPEEVAHAPDVAARHRERDRRARWARHRR